MFATALRTLGNAAEAEDVVQEAWLRWQNVHHDLVRNAPAFLTTTTLRLALNRATGARMRHETPLQPRLEEPVALMAGPGALVERGQALEAALRLLLERLSPVERAAYLLREAFDYSYRHIACIVHTSEENCRQLVTRARKHLAERVGTRVSAGELARVANAFSEATQTGDLARLEAVLAADIVDSIASNVTKRVDCLSNQTRSGGSR